MKYTTPSIKFFEVLAECGFGNSIVELPGFGTEGDDLIIAPTPTASNE